MVGIEAVPQFASEFIPQSGPPFPFKINQFFRYPVVFCDKIPVLSFIGRHCSEECCDQRSLTVRVARTERARAFKQIEMFVGHCNRSLEALETAGDVGGNICDHFVYLSCGRTSVSTGFLRREILFIVAFFPLKTSRGSARKFAVKTNIHSRAHSSRDIRTGFRIIQYPSR